MTPNTYDSKSERWILKKSRQPQTGETPTVWVTYKDKNGLERTQKERGQAI